MPKTIPEEFKKFLKGCSPEERNALMKSADEDDDEDPEADPNADDGEGEDEDDDSMEKSVLQRTLEKSLGVLQRLGYAPPDVASDPLTGDSDIGLAKSMDATGFVKSLVDRTAAALDNVSAGSAEVAQAQAVTNTAVLATGRMVLGLTKSLDALVERLDALGAPSQPRSTGARPIVKSFGAPGGGEPRRVTRGQIEAALEKAMKAAGDAGDTYRRNTLAKSLSLYSGSDGRIIDQNAQPIVAALTNSGNN